jgi:hypothetical protein
MFRTLIDLPPSFLQFSIASFVTHSSTHQPSLSVVNEIGGFRDTQKT